MKLSYKIYIQIELERFSRYAPCLCFVNWPIEGLLFV